MHYGYAPILTFELNINEDMDLILHKACDNKNNQQFRCHMDGDIYTDEYIKLACFKIEESNGAGGGGPTIALT